MYNLNVNMATSASSLGGLEGSCTTPKTPEVVNSVIAMSSSPFTYPGGGMPHQHHLNNNNPHHPMHQQHHQQHPSPGGGPMAANAPSSEQFVHPASQMPPPSVQHTCSQLIKEGLKLTIQSKRKHSGSDPGLVSPDEQHLCKMPKMQHQQQPQQQQQHHLPPPQHQQHQQQQPQQHLLQMPFVVSPNGTSIGSSGDDELTAEDEERRRRRRERNKIAATKCRLKKREKTVNLVQESEVLDTQNQELKSQIKQLELEQRQLLEMLAVHNQSCAKNVGGYPGMSGGDPSGMGGHMTPQHHQQQQQQHHQYPNYYAPATPGPCSPPQESPPNPYPHHHVELGGYQHHQGMDSGCLA